ncbi:SDR family NAD(P)-dependent oxidoreductase [Hyphomicrobiales bacterium 4NK60-0047b]
MSNSYKKRKPATLITGGSRGIGFALADLFARRGETLYLVARDLKQLQHSAYELKKNWECEVFILSADLMENDAANTILKKIKQDGFYVETLINSAAIAYTDEFANSHFETIKSLAQLNMITPTELTHRCIEEMQEHGGGGILNIASFAGLMPVPKLALYSASKSYLIALTRALSEELQKKNIKISVVVPGPVDTEFLYQSEGSTPQLVPMLTPESVAQVSYEGFLAGQTIITPGFLGIFYRIGIKLLPHKLLTWTLRPLINLIYLR